MLIICLRLIGLWVGIAYLPRLAYSCMRSDAREIPPQVPFVWATGWTLFAVTFWL